MLVASWPDDERSRHSQCFVSDERTLPDARVNSTYLKPDPEGESHADENG